MAGRIRQEDLEAVRERTDLVKLVSGYLTLKKSGHDSFSGLCPFHTEKTPSFSVSPSKQVYYCFGCGAGGDAIRFLRDIEHLEFTEAVERLAKDAGVTLRYEGDTPGERRAASRRQALHRANEEAAALYHTMLMEGREGDEARAYLDGRGIDREAAVAFGIGYAPGYPDFLLRRLARGFSPEILLEAGLAVRDQSGAVRDRFRGRITFPVDDLSGRAVGIGARILPGGREEGPKYLNSPETPIYKKGEVLYNLHRAKAAVTKSGEIFVVEGYTDVIATVRSGIEQAVATCGTALGEGHFRLASRFARRMVLAFDSDEAGARAAERAFEFHESFPIEPFVLVLPDGLDPADFVQRHGGQALHELAAGAEAMVRYMLRRIAGRHDLSTPEGKTQAVVDGLPMIEALKNPAYRDQAAHVLAEFTGAPENSVLLMLEQKLKGKPLEVARTIKRASVHERVEREMLKLLARDADVFRVLSGNLSEEHFRSAQNRKLFAMLVEAEGDVGSLIAGTEDEKTVRLLSGLALEDLDGDQTSEYAERVWSRLHEFLLARRRDGIRNRLQKMNPLTDESYLPLFQEMAAVEGELRRLKERGGVPA